MKPIQLVDQFGRPLPASNKMIRAATQTAQRQQIPMLDRDTNRNMSSYGRRTLMTIGRYLYWNFPAVKGAIDEQADLAASHLIPQFKGMDKAWGMQAEELLTEWGRICNVQGWPYDECTLRQHLIAMQIVDGDIGLAFIETPGGYPQVQTIMSHRIGSAIESGTLKFNGGILNDGVYLDSVNRATGYAITDGTYSNTIQQNVSAKDMILCYSPDVPDQSRGISLLCNAAFDWQDIYERRQFELVAQKVGAAISLIETNETGDADPARTLLTNPDADVRDADGNVDGLFQQQFDGGLVRYFRSQSGSGLQAFRNDRPSADAMAHEMEIVRSAMAGMHWSVDFSLDPTKAGGASMRVVVERINRTLAKRRRYIAQIMRRVHGWRIAKAMQMGELPWNDEWFRWEYQGPADLTADKKYDSEVDIAEVSQGFSTRKDAIARRGGYIEEVDKQRFEEADSDFRRASELSKKWGVSIEAALTVLRPPTPNGMIAPAKTEADGGGDDNGRAERMANIEEVKALADSFGVGVRAGTITPTIDDENFMRSKLGLPPVTEAARKAWSKDGGTRRPITLLPPPGTAAPAPGGFGGNGGDE